MLSARGRTRSEERGFKMRLHPMWLAAVVLVFGLSSLPELAADEAKRAVEAKPAAGAQPAAGKDDGFVSLFDGKSLDGWVVTNCKAAVEGGSLVILEGNGLVRSDKVYGDFVLEL